MGGALQRHFGKFNLQDSLRSELKRRVRHPGELLGILAYDIEGLCRRVYAAMSPDIHRELTRDQFIQALMRDKLRLLMQLAHPSFLSEALQLAMERETAVGALKHYCTETSMDGGPFAGRSDTSSLAPRR